MIITLPWPPSGLSPNARLHWSEKARLAKKYREACCWQSKEQGVRLIDMVDKVSIKLSITFIPPTRRAYDLDNALSRIKNGLDGLSDALGVDDKHWTLTIQKGEGIGGMVKVEITQ
ncbi:MAG: hypothetical protein ACRCVX_14390 [Shewanella sp.]